MRQFWRFHKDTVYLNHGTVGVTPIPVLETQIALRNEIEAAPGPYFANHHHPRLRQAANRVAQWLGANEKDSLVFVDNATTGINAVLNSLTFAPDDEILVTSNTYGAVRNAARFTARSIGAHVVSAELPFPLISPQQALDVVEQTITSKTRLAILDHIVSETAQLMPIRALIEACHAHGVPILVDGAHAPGQTPINLSVINADWYAGNLHKWAFAPRGCGFLWKNPSSLQDIHHPVISWGLDKGYIASFDWVGTRDPTPWLCAPIALDFIEAIGFNRLLAYNHTLTRTGAEFLARTWKTDIVTAPEMSASMIVVPLPHPQTMTQEEAEAMRLHLWQTHHLEVPIVLHKNKPWVRLSTQVYNSLEDFQKLADCLKML
ncbi:isopenicillin-N epimerase [Azospirillaceae bacterium]